MKPIILLAIIFLFAKCNKVFYQDKKLKHNTNYCLCSTKYIKKIDLTKPYYVNGKYCIESIKDTIGKKGIGFMCVNVFDRITGTILKNCTIKISGKVNTIEDLEAGYAT
ncbi:MAG: hypothetical protein J7578_24660, partial [Chitinophagaceae bacterium]|nr:hypothetical protein [Chitinophagaceae bacterium]